MNILLSQAEKYLHNKLHDKSYVDFLSVFKNDILRLLGFTVSPSTLLSPSKHCFMKIFAEYCSTGAI